jgi:hypothetical protein
MDAVVSAKPTGSVDSDTATFTKWLVGEGPAMAGVVGGGAGEGTFAGTVVDMKPGPTTAIEARYEFHGADRQSPPLSMSSRQGSTR